MYIRICIYINICTHKHIYTHTHTYIHIYIYMYVYIYAYMYIHIYVCMHIHTCTHIHIYVHTYRFMHIHMNLYEYVHTHIHAHARTIRSKKSEYTTHTHRYSIVPNIYNTYSKKNPILRDPRTNYSHTLGYTRTLMCRFIGLFCGHTRVGRENAKTRVSRVRSQQRLYLNVRFTNHTIYF